ncbi:DUF1385 domain-containing protein [Fervidobacterium thailandense]|uniref:Metal-dependent enzyme n=1 Tax=Fervidobacterium thailandense TaxID=1008305 RepID=A0A1E3G1A9_9BACT|nr:DUF1385 domain-containing protein [Fervidobacterium thailandense]ODN30039.1 metal-dependent enzyme [Fervidobacterium thailandense]
MKVGGQAVIEGVLMMGKKVVVAVRRPDGGIETRELGTVQVRKLARVPFVRGVFSLFYSLSFGIKALDLSAKLSSEEEMKKGETFLSLLISIALGIGLFIVLPAYLTRWLGFRSNEFVFSLVDGFIRLAIFLLYVWIISLFKDVKRVFQYHGAEHKVVHTFEHGEELSVENARKYSTIHPRCGTNFVMIFLIVAILVHSLFGIFGPLNMFQRVFLRILVLPVVAGLSYELLKFFDKYPKMLFLAAPGLLLQRLTTAEPDDSQLEVAIVALRHALELGEQMSSSQIQENSSEVSAEASVEFLG